MPSSSSGMVFICSVIVYTNVSYNQFTLRWAGNPNGATHSRTECESSNTVRPGALVDCGGITEFQSSGRDECALITVALINFQCRPSEVAGNEDESLPTWIQTWLPTPPKSLNVHWSFRNRKAVTGFVGSLMLKGAISTSRQPGIMLYLKCRLRSIQVGSYLQPRSRDLPDFMGTLAGQSWV